MGQCAIKTPLIDLLHYEIQNGDDIRISIQDDPSTPDTPSVAYDTTDKQRIENERRRIIYERQLSKEINDNYIRKTRKEILFPLIQMPHQNYLRIEVHSISLQKVLLYLLL